MSAAERSDFEVKLKELYESHGGNAIFSESKERQKEILERLEVETEQLFRSLTLGGGGGEPKKNQFRARRLTYGTVPAAEEMQKQQAKPRRASQQFRSPPLVPSMMTTQNRSNRRIKVKPGLDDENKKKDKNEKTALENSKGPPFPDETLGTYSHHGIEPKYYGEGFTSKINQDRGCVAHPYVDSETQSLFCVFDGHGERGEDVSEFVLESIVQNLERDPELSTQPERALTKAFLQADDDLEKSDIDSFFSGTTAVAVYRNGNAMYTANAGDSRAIIARRDAANPQHLLALPLSIDHNPDTPGERERIESLGGFVSDPPGEGLSARVWLDPNMTRVGLAMARSIGDNAVKKVGVIAEPEVRKHLLTDDDVFMILASDGVWEFISSEDAVSIVHTALDATNSASAACKRLIDAAIQCWKENEGDYRDDITAIVMRLAKYPEASSS